MRAPLPPKFVERPRFAVAERKHMALSRSIRIEWEHKRPTVVFIELLVVIVGLLLLAILLPALGMSKALHHCFFHGPLAGKG